MEKEKDILHVVHSFEMLGYYYIEEKTYIIRRQGKTEDRDKQRKLNATQTPGRKDRD